jgi:hypothetical protein
MQLSNQEAERLVREGAQALQQGRAQEARSRFEQVAATGRANAQIWLLLATACRAQNDVGAEERALDRLLELERLSIRGLVMKGDCRAKAGDERKAADFYKKALHVGSERAISEPEAVELRRAEEAVRQLDARRIADLETRLANFGLPVEQRSARFQRSLDIMGGRKRAYFQEPTGYYFPELPQVQFYDPAMFPWASVIEAATSAIRHELSGALNESADGFRPYIQSEASQPRNHPLLDKKDWSALFFCENGVLAEPVIAQFPRTWQAIQTVPLPWIEKSSPTVMFSLLRPGARIPAHRGVHNTRLICHLPLIVPPGCGFRVGNEIRQWEEGKLFIFDDSIEHEAWNEGSEDRVILIFDIWRPELSEQERKEISALFALALS